MLSILRRCGAGVLALSFLGAPVSALASPGSKNVRSAIVYRLNLPNGTTAVVFANGAAQVFSKDHRKVATEIVRSAPHYDSSGIRSILPDEGEIVTQLSAAPKRVYAPDRVIVVYRDGTRSSKAVVSVEPPVLRALRAAAAAGTLTGASTPAYTNSFAVNRALASIGVDRSERLFRDVPSAELSALRGSTASNGAPALDLTNAYRLHVSGASVPQALAVLAKLPEIAYASPDWTVSTMQTRPVPVQPELVRAARARASIERSALGGENAKKSTLPSNYALTASAQSLLNAPSTDAAAAFDEIAEQFHQIPGQGERVTNVSLADLDDAAQAGKPHDPCAGYVSSYGPTSEIVRGQRYLNLPSMPLIPTYTADSNGVIDPVGSVCGIDPNIVEVGLDFSLMSALPHNLQRPGEQGSAQTDLLGIAPGADYRLIVPASSAPSTSDVDAALLAAATQKPKPDVITSSLGFGFDAEGFPARYLEEDPLTEQIVASIVQKYHIVVCISGGDGTREATTAAIGPSGGSVATDVIPPGGSATSLGDDGYSTIPSYVPDSGAIDVGASTLDDIFADPPQYAASPQAIAAHAYAETRWTGLTNFSSAFGTRVDVSAPGDNALGLEHLFGGADDAVAVVLEGGTSVSAPETAAAAAVLLQVARLTGKPIDTPKAVRTLLKQTGSPVATVTQADRPLRVGPQIDVRAAVEKLIERGLGQDNLPKPGVARVAVEQRRDDGNLNGAFLSDTDPQNIDLAGGTRPGADLLSWITIAPDWTFVPAGATYALFVKGNPRAIVAKTKWARVLPQTIFKAAGLPTVSPSSRTVKLTYEARVGRKVMAQSNVTLTFGASFATQDFLLAPKVPSVVKGPTIRVTYDASAVGSLNRPKIVVSQPGRIDPVTGALFHPAYVAPLTSKKGTVEIPVSELQGGGIYGIGIEMDSLNAIYSNFAFTRVAPAGAQRPAAPLLSIQNSKPGHYLEVPYGAPFQVHYDVTGVKGATGAELEISAAGPGAWGNDNPFNNPNGTIEDGNGVDSGSVHYVPLSGTKGTATVRSAASGLYATLNHVVRVIPMKGAKAAGEGGDVSSVSMEGVLALDGGYANNGFGVNANGTDGFITSEQQLASGNILTSLDTFDQTTNRVAKTVASLSNSLYFTDGWGIYGNDIGLACHENVSTSVSQCNVLDPVAKGKVGRTWSPSGLPATYVIDEAAANTANDVAGFFGYDTSTLHYGLFTSNLASNTTSPLYDLMAPLDGFASPSYWGMAEDTATKTAVLPADDTANPSGPPLIVTVDLKNGKLSSFPGLGDLFPYGIAIDSLTHKAAVPTLGDGGLTIYNLTAKTGHEVILPQPPNGGAGGLYTAADPVHTRFLVEQTTSPNFASNNNSLSRVLIYDEHGNLLDAIERFSLFNTFTTIQDNELQVNPSKRRGYLIGPAQQQLIPFNY